MKIQFREGWSSLLLILGMLLAVAWSLDAAQWTDGMSLVQWAVLIGLIWGVAGAKSIFPGWFMHLSALIQGLFWTSFLASSQLPGALTWSEKIGELGYRYWVWGGKAMAGDTNTDNIIFLMECLLALFLISYAAAWFAYRRHGTWQVILPAGIVLVLNIYNAQGSHGVFLFIYLICALLYAVRVHLTEKEDGWTQARIGYNRMVALDFLRDGAIFSVLVIVLAQALPAAAANQQVAEAIQTLSGPWQGARDKWGQLFATLNYKPEPTGTGYFGSALVLGGALHLNNTTMMEARMQGARYWQAMTYDKYTGKGWANGDPLQINMAKPDARLGSPGFGSRELVSQTIKVFYPTSQLFAAPMPVAWSRPVVLTINRDPASTAPDAAPLMLSAALSGIPTRANDEYTALSLVSKADNKQLRKASTEYPAWVKERYLQVPSTVPQRVKTLAERVVQQSGATNNFDKAVALEAYLRQFTYNEFIQAPPPDRDVVDYFLFTSRQGYCNYYASAMAVMLRMLDVPARVVSGYARGELDETTGAYLIRESDSHTWVEAFFTGYGWIQFEPTASQPTLDRVEGVDSPDGGNADFPNDDITGKVPTGRNKDDMIDELENQGGFGDASSFVIPELSGPLASIGYVGMAGVLVGLIGVALVALSWQRHVASLTPLEAEYEGMQRYARWLGMKPRAGQTPLEFGAALAGRIPLAATQILRLSELYVRSLFSRDGVPADDEREAKAMWPDVRRSFIKRFANDTLLRIVRPPEQKEKK